jgi:hypothetical protein
MSKLLTIYQNEFHPKNIPNLTLWLDAADSASISLSGSSVTQWSDKSGKGNNATQSTGAWQPTYSTTGLNGRPTITFASQQLNIINNSSLVYSSGITTFIVSQWTDNISAGGGGTVIFAKWGGGGNEWSVLTSSQNTTPVYYTAGAGQFVALTTGSVPITTNTPIVFSQRFANGAKQEVGVNRSFIQSAASISITNGTENIRIGSIFTTDTIQTISEILFYTRPFSDYERLETINYLVQKWRV